MVVRINPGKSIRGALSYNERKVAKGQAELLIASGFPTDAVLGFTHKLKRFQLLNELTDKVKTNTLHISLNFPPEELLTDQKMKAIAQDYMERIGFGHQPYLVYRHHDTKHPHLHIVTTTVQENQRGIPLHNLVKRKSEPARKSIEIDYGLIQASTRKKRGFQLATADNLLPVEYGKEEVKHAITNTLQQVLNSYRFSSIDELNVILRHFNVIADRGLTTSRIYQHRGLVFSVLDAKGYRICRSIKASEIYGAPTLSNLEKKFAGNAVKKIAVKDQVKNKIGEVLGRNSSGIEFSKRLEQRGILMHVDTNTLGAIKKVFFVDHFKKAVFTGQELDIPISVLSALNRTPASKRVAQQLPGASENLSKRANADQTPIWQFGTHSTHMLMQALYAPSHGSPGAAGDPPRKKKKKKRPPF